MLSSLQWRKSSRSAGNGNCVEAAPIAEAVAVRDSKLPTEGDFPHLLLDSGTWTGLITAIKSGELALNPDSERRAADGRPSHQRHRYDCAALPHGSIDYRGGPDKTEILNKQKRPPRAGTSATGGVEF